MGLNQLQILNSRLVFDAQGIGPAIIGRRDQTIGH